MTNAINPFFAQLFLEKTRVIAIALRCCVCYPCCGAKTLPWLPHVVLLFHVMLATLFINSIVDRNSCHVKRFNSLLHNPKF